MPNSPRTTQDEERTWACRFHPFVWWHEVGCPHLKWTPEQLEAARKCEKHPTFVARNCVMCELENPS